MPDDLPGLSALGGAGRPLTRHEWRARERERTALDLWRKDNLSYGQISKRLGLRSADRARELVRAGAERWDNEEGIHVPRWRAAMAGDLMELRALMMEAARGGDQMAVDRALKVWERLARLIGTDTDKQQAVQVGTVVLNGQVSEEQLASIPAGAEVIDARLPPPRQPAPLVGPSGGEPPLNAGGS